MQEVSNNKREIFDVQGMADAARSTEYESLESAASEIVDNAVEAHADNIKIIITSDVNFNTGRKEIKHVGFLDTGDGMDIDTLHGALVYGEGTRRSAKGIGRFGVGLGQASLFAAPRVEVYSWQDQEDIFYTYLDANEMKNGEQTHIEKPKKETFPSEFIKYQHQRYKTGTLVVWKNVDRSPVKTPSGLINRLNKSLGQTFRYFVSKEKYNCKITLIDNEQPQNPTYVKPRDPLFLLEDDEFLADRDKPAHKDEKQGEPAFEPFIPEGFGSNEIEKEIEYLNNNGIKVTAPVTIKFSIVKDRHYSDFKMKHGKHPGTSELGQEAKEREGITVVRSEREIDFGRFGFYDVVNQPTHRWWGGEIRFDSRLDEEFKVSSNKQHVELKKPNQTEKDEARMNDTRTLWETLDEIIRPAITQMKNKNQNRLKYKKNKAIDDVSNESRGSYPESNNKTEAKNSKINERVGHYKIENDAQSEIEKHIDSITNSEYSESLGPYLKVQETNKENQDIVDFVMQDGYSEIVINKKHFPLDELNHPKQEFADIFIKALSMYYYKNADENSVHDMLDELLLEIKNIIKEKYSN